MKRTVYIILFTGLFIASLIHSYYAFNKEYTQNTLFETSVDQKDLSTLYNYYVAEEPVLSTRPILGSAEAHITLLLVLDTNQEATKTVLSETAPYLMSSVVDTGKAQLAFKYVIEQAEYEQKKGRFIYAAASLCLLQAGKPLGVQTTLLETSEDTVPAFLATNGIDAETWAACQASPALAIDTIESTTYRLYGPSVYTGIDWHDNTIRYGVPTGDRLERDRRFKEIQLGI